MAYLEEKVEELRKEVDAIKAVLQEAQQNKIPEKTYSVAEVAKQAGIEPVTILYHLRKGNLKDDGKKKRCKRIPQSEVTNFLNNYNQDHNRQIN